MICEYIIKIDDEKKDIMGGMPLVEKPKNLVRCKDCKNGKPGECGDGIDCGAVWHEADWFCADGEHR